MPMEMRKIKKNTNKGWKIFLILLILANLIMTVLLILAGSEKKKLEAQFSDSIVTHEHVQEEIVCNLPETVYVANGITMELYNSQVTNLGAEINKYNVRWNCEIGENLERRFSVTANDENQGSYELTLEIYNNQLELIAEETCTLILVEADMSKRETANKILQLADVPEICLEQVMCSIDTKYNGTFDALKPEGLAQLQDVVYAVLCGNK